MSEENKYGDDAVYNTDISREEDAYSDVMGDTDIGEMMQYVNDADMATDAGPDMAGSPVQPGLPNAQNPVAPTPMEPDQSKIERNKGESGVPYLGPALDFSVAAVKTVGDATNQGMAGVDDAVRNTLNLVPYVEDFTTWLDETFTGGEYHEGMEPAKTAVGGFTREVTKFLTGYLPSARGIKKVAALARMGRASKELLAGAITEFAVRAPDEARFSDMLIKAGVPKNFVTEGLKSDPKDSKFEARIKNALEGTIAAGAVEGVIKAVRLYKQWRKVKNDQPELVAHAEDVVKADEIEGKAVVEALKKWGDPEAAVLHAVVKGSKVAAGKKGAATKATKDIDAQKLIEESKGIKVGEDTTVYVNYGRISKSEDVKQAIQMITEHTKPLIGKSKRYTMSHKQQVEYAERLGMTEKELLNRPDGSVWSAEQVIAARTLWENAAENLVVAAGKAAAPNAGKIDAYLYRKMQSVFTAINAEVRGASAESSRSLRAWGIEAPELAAKARMMSQMLDEHGGLASSKQMAERVLMLARNGTLTSKAGVKMLDKSAAAKVVDAFREAWVAGLLWLPSTHVVNGVSSMVVLMHQLANRKVASMMTDSIHSDEAAFALHGMMGSIKDAFRYFGKAFKSGDGGYWAGKAETTRQPAFTAEAFGLKSDTVVGNTVDAIGTGFRGSLRVLGATDEFSKTIAYRGELHALSLREASAKGLTGDDLAREIAKTLNNPPQRMKIMAQDAATYATFQDKSGQVASFLAKLRNDPGTNVVGRFALTMVLPFVKTPSRILNYTMEHSPAALMQKKFWSDINSGDPARAAMAKAKIATGTSMMAIALDWTDSDQLTGYGPRDKAERDVWLQEHKPYSLKVGGKWHSFNRMDPIGMMFGFAGDIATITHRYELGDADMDELSEMSAGMVLAMANVLVNKNYMQGFARTLNAVTDPERYGKWWLGSNLATFMPMTTLAGGVTRAMDDQIVRQQNTIGDFYSSRLLSMAETLAPTRDMWGRVIHRRSGYGATYDFISPIAAKPIVKQPINEEIMRLAKSPMRGDASVPRRLQKNTTFMEVKVDFSQWPHVFDQYAEAAGRDPIELTGKPLMETLNDMVNGEGFYGQIYEYMSSDFQKLDMIGGLVEMQRQRAQWKVYNDPDNAAFKTWLGDMQQNSMKIKQGDESAMETVPFPTP